MKSIQQESLHRITVSFPHCNTHELQLGSGGIKKFVVLYAQSLVCVLSVKHRSLCYIKKRKKSIYCSANRIL